MNWLLTTALLVASTSGVLTGATFVVLPHYSFPTDEKSPESYVFSTTSPALIAEIRNRIANNWPTTPLVRIAPGAHGINRNHVASGTPLWSWHVVELLEVGHVPTVPAVFPPPPLPYRETPLTVIDADVEGFIAVVGDVISPQYLTRIVEIDPDDVGRVVNVSSRGVLGSGERVLICGFIVQGTTPRLVLVRALGPSLAEFGVSGVAENPALTLFHGQTAIQGNDDWESYKESRNLIPRGLEPLHPKDAAIVMILEPGAYTIHASSSDEGIGLVDVFDLSGLR